MATQLASPPPKDNLFRALPRPIELIRSDGDGMPTLTGYLAVWDEWAEVNSIFEGHFMERFARGSFAKTFRENRDRIKCIFKHGLDPQVGDKPLGPVGELEEDDIGARCAVPLLDTSYNRDLLPGFEAGLYGMSFRFRTVKEDFVPRPRRAAHNPTGLAERSVTEAIMREFGPCTFPVYAGTSAGVRSITDDFIRERFAEEDETEKPRGDSTAYFRAPAVPAMTIREERSDRLYQRTIEHVGEVPWAIHPDALATILGIVSDRAAGKRLTDEEIRGLIGAREETSPAPASPVAVLSLRGPIIPHAGLFSDVSGATAVEEFQAAFRDAVASADVKAILMNVDSPGGEAALVPELATEIRNASGEKPIVAIANAFAASAAYWIACAADEFVVTPSGKVGSIGVYAAHDDMSAMQEKAGVKTTLVSAGKFKTERNPYEPLSDEAKAAMQEHVDEFYAMFVSSVAKNRGVTSAEVRSGFGQGRMVMAKAALEAGMVDKIATYDETLARLTKSAAAKSRSQSTEPEPPAATTPDKTKPEPSEATTRSLPRTGRAEIALPRQGAESLNRAKERLP